MPKCEESVHTRPLRYVTFIWQAFLLIANKHFQKIHTHSTEIAGSLALKGLRASLRDTWILYWFERVGVCEDVCACRLRCVWKLLWTGIVFLSPGAYEFYILCKAFTCLWECLRTAETVVSPTLFFCKAFTWKTVFGLHVILLWFHKAIIGARGKIIYYDWLQ